MHLKSLKAAQIHFDINMKIPTLAFVSRTMEKEKKKKKRMKVRKV